MSIVLGGQTLLSTSLHQMPEVAPYNNEPIRKSVYGVRGTLQITDERHGREIRIVCTFSSYSTAALLEAAMATLEAKVPALNDKTLVVVAGGSTLTYYHVTLDRVERLPNPSTGGLGPYYDGSGTNGWRQELVMVFWQSDATL